QLIGARGLDAASAGYAARLGRAAVAGEDELRGDVEVPKRERRLQARDGQRAHAELRAARADERRGALAWRGSTPARFSTTHGVPAGRTAFSSGRTVFRPVHTVFQSVRTMFLPVYTVFQPACTERGAVRRAAVARIDLAEARQAAGHRARRDLIHSNSSGRRTRRASPSTCEDVGGALQRAPRDLLR